MSSPTPPDPNTPPPNDAAQPKPSPRDDRAPTVVGDVNRVNVGAGAQVDQLAVGRNILQAKINIGSLVIPVRFLLVLLAVAAVLAVAVWWIITPPQMAEGASASNVAIVQFGEQDANGNVTNSAQGTYLADWLYNRLNSELADLDPADRPTIWHLATGFDPIHLFQKRTTAPILNQADAERVAKQVDARIVIYGNLVPGQSTVSFVPQFYIEQRAGEADELSGSQQLGQPIPIPTPVNDEYLRSTLQPIGRALVWFSRGLQNDLNGRYDLAYKVLKEGEANLGDWDENQGKEVLYYFIGREALFLANCESDAALIFKPGAGETAVQLALNDAEQNFKRAQDIALHNGRTYARADFGLGQVALQRAQRLLIPAGSANAGQCRINIPAANLPCPQAPAPPTDPAILQNARTELDRAIVFLDRARAELPNPAPSRLDGRISGARANADALVGQLLLLGQNPADAEPYFQNAARALLGLTQTTPAEDSRTLAVAWLSLGAAQRGNGVAHLMQGDSASARTELQNAVDSFAACVKMIPADEPDVFLRSNVLPNCVCAQQSTQNMLDTVK